MKFCPVWVVSVGARSAELRTNAEPRWPPAFFLLLHSCFCVEPFSFCGLEAATGSVPGQTGVGSCDPGLGSSALIWAPRHQLTRLSSLIRPFVSAGARDDQRGRRQQTVVTVIAPATGLTADSGGMDTALNEGLASVTDAC